MHERRKRERKKNWPPHNALSSGTFDMFMHVSKQYWPGKLKRSTTKKRENENIMCEYAYIRYCSEYSARLMKRRVNKSE